MASATGRCLCGGVSFTAEGVEAHHYVCHCGMCRRWSGGPFFAAVTQRVSFEGAKNVATYQSSDWAERGFCKSCGTSLFYRLKPTGQYLMSVGAFDDPSPFRLIGEIFFDRKPPGYAFAGDHPRLSEAETLAKFAPKE